MRHTAIIPALRARAELDFSSYHNVLTYVTKRDQMRVRQTKDDARGTRVPALPTLVVQAR